MNFAASPTIVDLAGNALPSTEPAIDETYVVQNNTLTATIVGNDLVIDDIDGIGKNNLLSVSRSGANILITDANESVATGIAGAVLSNSNKTVSVPVSTLGVGGKIVVKGEGGSDSLSVDVSTDLGFDVDFQGGTGTSDSLTLAAATVASVTHTFTNANDGAVTIVNGGSRVITYTGLEPITDNMIATDRVFTFNGGAETIALTDGTASDGKMTIDSNLSESVSFTNPSGSLTINAGTGADIVNITSVDAGFNAALTINGNAGNDTVNLNADITFASNKSFDVDLTDDATGGDVDAVSVGTNANLILSGTGAATLKTSKNIALASGSSVTTVKGSLTLSANQQTTATTGSFSGIALNAATLSITGSGVLSLDGRGGDSGDGQYGIDVINLSLVSGGATGTTSLTGTGGASAGKDAMGIEIRDSSVTSVGASIHLTGHGGDSGNGTALGVLLNAGGGSGRTLSAGGSGSVTVDGTGGAGTGNANLGVGVASSMITSSGGAVTVTGTGGGQAAGSLNVGVGIVGGTITSGVTGLVTVTGTGGLGSSAQGVDFNLNGAFGSAPAAITSAGGSVIVTGTAGSGVGNLGINLWQAGTISTTGSGNATLIADSIAIDTSGTPGTVNVGGNAATLRQKTNGTAIDLGGVDAASTLGLTDAELDRITAGRIVVGDANAGAVTFSAAIGLANSNTLEIITGGDITESVSGNALFGDSLILNGALAPALTGRGTFDIDGTVTFATTASYKVNLNGTDNCDQLVVAGDSRVTTLGGAMLVITLDTVPAVGSQDVFRIIDSTGTGSTVSGTFKNGATTLNDGDTFTVGSTIFRINYLAGGDVTVTEAGNTPPVVDLNGAGTGVNYTAAFVEDAGAKNIADTTATITDSENATLANLKLVVSANPDGAAESLTMAGVVVPLNADATGSGIVGGTTFQVA